MGDDRHVTKMVELMSLLTLRGTGDATVSAMDPSGNLYELRDVVVEPGPDHQVTILLGPPVSADDDHHRPERT